MYVIKDIKISFITHLLVVISRFGEGGLSFVGVLCMGAFTVNSLCP